MDRRRQLHDRRGRNQSSARGCNHHMGTPSRRLPDGVTRRDLSTRGAGLRTLLIFAALQAFLLSINPQLLSMWGEEAMSLCRASSPLGGILRLAHAEAQPPLYLLLLHGVLKLTGA